MVRIGQGIIERITQEHELAKCIFGVDVDWLCRVIQISFGSDSTGELSLFLFNSTFFIRLTYALSVSSVINGTKNEQETPKGRFLFCGAKRSLSGMLLREASTLEIMALLIVA